LCHYQKTKMPRTLQEVKEEVIQHVGQRGFDDFLEYLGTKGLGLWGGKRPRGFLEAMVVLLFYKLIIVGTATKRYSRRYNPHLSSTTSHCSTIVWS
jgi:hypothetical protein